MPYRTRFAALVLAAVTLPLAGPVGAADGSPGTNTAGDLLFGGCGGVYLLAEPGELVVEVTKRDRNRRGRHTELRAILVGPDRRGR